MLAPSQRWSHCVVRPGFACWRGLSWETFGSSNSVIGPASSRTSGVQIGIDVQFGRRYIFVPMPACLPTATLESMSTFAPACDRTDAVNDLQDSACDLLFAAQ